MKDSLNKIRGELAAIGKSEPASPVEQRLIEICDRLAAQIQRVERKIAALDRATENARSRTAVYGA